MRISIAQILICSFFLLASNFGISQQQNTTAIIIANSSSEFIKKFSKTSGSQKGINKIPIAISSSQTLNLNLNITKQENKTTFLIGSVNQRTDASFNITYFNEKLQGSIIDKKSNQAFRLYSDENNQVFIEEVDINTILCIAFDKAKETETALKEPISKNSKLPATGLQSRPEAEAVIYLDFDGETVTGSSWNNGNTINAQSAGLSDVEITIAWEIMAEDFRPFDVNVVTDRSVFDATPKNSRMMCIFTPTDTAQPNSGGVAFLSSFSWNNDDPAWVYNIGSGKQAGDTGSHEIGHTMGLDHDGKDGSEYYSGHGNWGPIMGYSLNKSIAQWSLGEYTGATRLENDVQIIGGGANNFGYVIDDHGNDINSATAVISNSNGMVASSENHGIIHTRDDIDLFSIFVEAGQVIFNFNPHEIHANLNIAARLLDANGTEITSSDPSGQSAYIATSVTAGLYFLEVQGSGEGTVNNGYSDYASLGRYSFFGQYTVQTPENDLRLIAITPNEGSLECGSISPTVEIINDGLNTIAGFDILYRINNGTQEIQSFSNSISPQETLVISLSEINLTTVGDSTIEIIGQISNDDLPNNNTKINNFFGNTSGIATQVNSFETIDGTLIAYDQVGEGSIWERGTPNDSKLSTAFSGTNAYGTVLNGNYTDAKKSYLVTNCYDFSSIENPILKFQMAYDIELNYDALYMEYSVDAGNSWNLLGAKTSLPNWYTSDRIENQYDCQLCPGGQWTGIKASFNEYAYDFALNSVNETDLTTADNIMFRFVFHTDEYVNQEGALIDDFVIEGIIAEDDDDDNDGILDVNDNCSLTSNSDQLNTDGDELGNACDDDDDNDGILDLNDNCPLTANPDQADTDKDGNGDVCENPNDNDGDGVLNTDDLNADLVLNENDNCPNTSNTDQADIDNDGIGDVCDDKDDRFLLPDSNYKILNIPSCQVNKGSLQIDVIEDYRYQVTLSNSDFGISKDFTDFALFTDLDLGLYTVCITVDGEPDYEYCYDIVIEPSEVFSVLTEINYETEKVTLSMTGGEYYTISLNDELQVVSENNITLTLNAQQNNLVVSSSHDCDNAYVENIILSPEVLIYPNPIEGDELTIYLDGIADNTIQVSLFTIRGTIISSSIHTIVHNQVSLPIIGLANGIYIITIGTSNEQKTYKIIRK